jgi:hypothetical protein
MKTDSSQDAWAKVAGVSVSPGDILLELKAGEGISLLESLGIRRALAARAEAEGLTVADKDVEEALVDFFVERDLYEEDQISRWLETSRLTRKSVRQYIRINLLAKRLEDSLAPEDAVQQRFQQNQPDYAEAKVEVTARENEGAARELMVAIREGEIPWPGGERRQLLRKEAPEEIAGALFSAEIGELVGPLEADDGTFEVWRLTGRTDAELTEDLQDRIREELIQEETDRMLCQNPVSFLK